MKNTSVWTMIGHPILRALMLGLLSVSLNGVRPPERQPAQRKAEPAVTAFVNVHVVPMDTERVLRHQTLLVRGDRIVDLGPSETVVVPDDAVRIDGTGRYLMPGLADMHVHLWSMSEEQLILFVANGVTTVRNMWGQPIHLEWRERAKQGTLMGPSIYTTGPITDGDPVWWPGSTSITTVDQARQEVLAQQRAGYDGMKVLGVLSPDVYRALVSTANENDFPVYGHAPVLVGLREALGSGQRSFEHMLDYLWAMLPDGSPARAGVTDWFLDPSTRSLRTFFLDPFREADPATIPDLAARTAAADVWVCPTLVAHRNAMSADAAHIKALRGRPSMRFVAPDILEPWAQRERFFLSDEMDPDLMKRGFLLARRMVGALHDAGVSLLVGTDTPNPFVVPGFSIHEELHLLTEAGLSPFEALSATTRGPAAFLGASDAFGTVAVGLEADLILVDENPLEDVSNASRRQGVMLQGTWLPEETLQEMLADLAASYKREEAARDHR